MIYALLNSKDFDIVEADCRNFRKSIFVLIVENFAFRRVETFVIDWCSKIVGTPSALVVFELQLA